MSLVLPPTVLPTQPDTALSDGRVRLRQFRAEDIPLLFAAVRESMKEMSVWLAWCHPNYSLEESTQYVLEREEEWRKDAHYSFGITDVLSGEFVGSVGLNFVNRTHHFANLGYWVRSRSTGQGIATRAVRLIARWGFEKLKFARLEIVVGLDNIASQRVAQKAGAMREGILRNRVCLHGQQRDAVMFSLVPKDLEKEL